MFSRYGVPNSLRTDNGRQFISEEFVNCLKEIGTQHRKNTPLWLQANGEVERQNRSLLKILKIAKLENKCRKAEVNKFLMAYRATAHPATGETPSKLLFGREMITKVPDLLANYHNDAVQDADSESKTKMKDYRDRKVGAKEVHIQVGDRVFAKEREQAFISIQERGIYGGRPEWHSGYC